MKSLNTAFSFAPPSILSLTIYEDIGSEFVYDQELCDAINVELPEDATAEQVKEMIN